VVRFEVGRSDSEAEWEADVERFLRKGILERRREGSCGGEYGGERFVVVVDCRWFRVEASIGVLPFMSPNSCSVSLTASSWATPAKATTILSGL